MKASCSQGLQMSLPLSLSGCNPFLSSSISLLPSPALRFVCFSFSSLFFCRSRLRRGMCCLPDAEMDYWINSSIGCSASQRLEVREVINSQPSPFAHCKGAEAIDLADSVGFRSHITACISVGNKSIYISDVSLSNKKETYAILLICTRTKGKNAVCVRCSNLSSSRVPALRLVPAGQVTTVLPAMEISPSPCKAALPPRGPWGGGWQSQCLSGCQHWRQCLYAVPCLLPCKCEKPKGRCGAHDRYKHENGTLGRWEATWLGTAGKALKVLSNSGGAKAIQAEG